MQTSALSIPFEEVNGRRVQNHIAELKPQQKSIELKVVVISKDAPKELKNKEILTQCLVADHSAKVLCNFYGELGKILKPGDIVYLSGAYTSIFKDHMVLYQSAKGGVYRLRNFFFVFDPSGPNMSEPTYAMEIDPKTGREMYTIVKSSSNNTMPASPDKQGKNM